MHPPSAIYSETTLTGVSGNSCIPMLTTVSTFSLFPPRASAKVCLFCFAYMSHNAQLIATIQNIENNGLIIAERQLWVKKLESKLYEIRSKRASNIQRAIYFQVQGSQYLITNAFTKKTQKTPESEKKIARNRRSQYFNKEDQ
ncbi:type II toxin-antitoxin system RelE/ParE family toxin [Liquorilactobacillus hordei]|uniref:type II toxin-antitoxin system RelE/ParE family toxin n=1 Tax=Liquorilactobacillus hordei TaxID=468911 RepID=UPI0039ED927E